MKKRNPILFPKNKEILYQLGENIKLARKRRNLTTTQLSERADISRSTLYLIEQGNESVALGHYFNVLRVLNLEKDFLKLASDDILGRKLQDLELLSKSENERDVIKSLIFKLRVSVVILLKRGYFSNDTYLKDILGCEYQTLVDHLNTNEFGFKVGEQNLDVDHIIPLTKAKSKEEVETLCHYTNLQLLPSYYNRMIKKDNDWDRDHFIKWYETF